MRRRRPLPPLPSAAARTVPLFRESEHAPAPTAPVEEEITPERRGYVLARSVIRDPKSSTNAKKVARMLITLLEKNAPTASPEGEAAE